MNERKSRRQCLLLGASVLGALGMGPARAESTDRLRAFIRDIKFGQADFTQTVTSPDGARKKVSTGRLEFLRPDRFRFTYAKPYPLTIVGDGQKVWFHDPDLNQVTVRRWNDVRGTSVAALLAGEAIDRVFELRAVPAQDAVELVLLSPKDPGGTLQWMKAGFRGARLLTVEMADSFGQQSLLQFGEWEPTAPAPERFRFVAPVGADVSES